MGIVLNIIFKSSERDQLSIYSISSFIHLSKETELLPFTCQRQVIPGARWNGAMPVLIKANVVPNRQGSRPDQAHVAFRTLKELWQLIYAGFAKQFANTHQSWIVFYFKYRAVASFSSSIRLSILCTMNHWPEFNQLKPSFVKAHPILDEKYWSLWIKFNEKWYQQENGESITKRTADTTCQ